MSLHYTRAYAPQPTQTYIRTRSSAISRNGPGHTSLSHTTHRSCFQLHNKASLLPNNKRVRVQLSRYVAIRMLYLKSFYSPENLPHRSLFVIFCIVTPIIRKAPRRSAIRRDRFMSDETSSSRLQALHMTTSICAFRSFMTHFVSDARNTRARRSSTPDSVLL